MERASPGLISRFGVMRSIVAFIAIVAALVGLIVFAITGVEPNAIGTAFMVLGAVGITIGLLVAFGGSEAGVVLMSTVIAVLVTMAAKTTLGYTSVIMEVGLMALIGATSAAVFSWHRRRRLNAASWFDIGGVTQITPMNLKKPNLPPVPLHQQV
ncbi:hypothetical protein EPO04_01300 [Patescibacteria group bacterium]|nr:MAG: hypothetical protein EPO04_01300 [Patescibacteria group bacterium]